MFKLISFLISTNKLYRYARSVRNKENDNLFIIAGSNLETSWTQIFIVLLLLISDKIKNVYVLTSRKFIQNLYYLKFNFELFIEDLDLEIQLPKKLQELKYLKDLNDFRDFVYDDVFGRIALLVSADLGKLGLLI